MPAKEARGVARGALFSMLLASVGIALQASPTARRFATTSDATPSRPDISEAAARSLESKLAVLVDPQPRAAGTYRPIVITETETNSYLRLHGHEFLPPAVHDPTIQIAPELLTATAEVDFDQLGEIGDQTDDWSAKLLALVFKGKQRVLATGKLETENRQGRLTIESLTVGSTSIPAAFVNLLVQSYLERQYNIDLSKPFTLPDHVTHIELGTGRATFHRRAARL